MSGTLFELIGMIAEDPRWTSDFHTRNEAFFSDETKAVERFEAVLRLHAREQGIEPAIEKPAMPGNIALTSPIVRSLKGRFLIRGMITREVFATASDEDFLRYAFGAYSRFGIPGNVSGFSSTSPGKLETIGLILSKLGCSDVRLYRDYLFSTGFCLLFKASPAVKERLGIQHAWTIAEFAVFRSHRPEEYSLLKSLVWTPSALVDVAPGPPVMRSFYPNSEGR